MTKFKSQALHIKTIKYWNAGGRGYPPSCIPALWNIGILLHKQATRTKHFEPECTYWLGGSEKVPKPDYVIFKWSLMHIVICTCDEMLCLIMIYKKLIWRQSPCFLSWTFEMIRTPIKSFSNKRSLQKKLLCNLNQQREKNITFTRDGSGPLYSWKSNKKSKVFPVL